MKTLHTIYTSFAKRFTFVLTLLTLGVTSVLAAEYEEMLVLDVAKGAPTGTTSTAMSTANEIKSYLEAASSGTNEIKSVENISGNIYKGKGSGGDGIPQKCLKIGKASGPGSFTFTIADSFDNISKVVLVGYGWKTTTAVSVNNLDALKPTKASTEVSFEYILGTPTKTISISVATSAFWQRRLSCTKKLLPNVLTP